MGVACSLRAAGPPHDVQSGAPNALTTRKDGPYRAGAPDRGHSLESLPVTVEALALLLLVAVAGGFVDSMAGGGGLLTVPALLAAGLGPTAALATNKVQSSFGAATATWNYTRGGAVVPRLLAPAIATTFTGAAAGTLLVQRVDPGFLETLLPFLVLAVAAYFLLAPRAGEVERAARLSSRGFAGTAAPAVGFYDGFFGPGTGSFFALAFVSLRGMELTGATAATKVLNLTSNLAAVLFFALGGVPAWRVGLVMAVGQATGARLGSSLVLARGSRLVRPLLVVVSVAISLRLLLT